MTAVAPSVLQPGMAPAAARPRLLGNLLFYPAFYLGGFPLVVIACLALPFSPRLLRACVHWWTGWHRFCARHLLGIRVVVEGVPPTSGVLYAMRHESFFEAIDAPVLFDRPVVIAKQELLDIPLWGRAAREFGLIAVDRDGGARALRAMVASARERAASGRPLVIYPEGTRVPHGQQRPLQAGFAALYKLLGLPVVPVAVVTGPLYHRWWKRPGTVTYAFGEAIPPGLPREEVEARVHAAINRLNADG